jgi:hypothetical protein
MENAVIFTYGHLEYFRVIWYILWPFGNVVVIWYIFPRFGILCQEKSGNPACNKSRARSTESPRKPGKIFYNIEPDRVLAGALLQLDVRLLQRVDRLINDLCKQSFSLNDLKT